MTIVPIVTYKLLVIVGLRYHSHHQCWLKDRQTNIYMCEYMLFVFSSSLSYEYIKESFFFQNNSVNYFNLRSIVRVRTDNDNEDEILCSSGSYYWCNV